MRTSFKVKGQKSRSPGRLMLKPKGKFYELQTWYTDGPRRRASPASAVTSKLADNSRTKRPRSTKIDRMVVHSTDNNAHQFQGQRSRSPGRLMLRPKLYHKLSTEREGLRTSKLLRRWSMLSTATASCYSLKAYKVGYCTRAEAYRVGRIRRPHNLLVIVIINILYKLYCSTRIIKRIHLLVVDLYQSWLIL